jgi:hypothetical protein
LDDGVTGHVLSAPPLGVDGSSGRQNMRSAHFDCRRRHQRLVCAQPSFVHFSCRQTNHFPRPTVLTTDAIDVCAGERLVRPWDFRRLCKAGACKTYLFTASHYGVDVAQIVPNGRDRYVAVFQPTTVPCPHRPGEDTGTNRSYSTITLWWSPDMQIVAHADRAYEHSQ